MTSPRSTQQRGCATFLATSQSGLPPSPLVPLEFKEFLFTRWFRSRFNVSNDVAFAESMKNATSHNITLMERDRFIAIQSCTRGYAQAGRTASVESNVWMQQGALLRK
ncbi:hypothetical protein IV203_014448 [Nitzschia inconspicua]|uniref:Uncharacterized protein n=1 Tax=Nitzschia inconspicua TaxID=303405 RepID=A0A9K3LAN1_9STRA|nr:hypothetical protein IV203_014448 [Nitzschia inconspicua]